MRNVKMLGLSQKMSKTIQAMREGEMEISKDYRKVQSLNVSLGKLLNNFLSYGTPI